MPNPIIPVFSVDIKNRGQDVINIRSDEIKIRQILFNLVSNACKHSEESIITVDIDIEASDDIDMLVCKVIDKGSPTLIKSENL